MMADQEQTNQSQYNLNEQTILLIADLQRDGITKSNNYNFNKAFDCWQSIRLLIQSRFEDDEKDKLDRLEKEFQTPIPLKKLQQPKYNKLGIDAIRNNEKRYNQIRINIIKRQRLNVYVKELMQLMRVYQISLTDKKLKTNLN